MAKQIDTEKLKKIALDLRRAIIKMTAQAGSGHPGGSLSSADIITALFFHVMNYDPKNPKWPGRDRFHLSKGHACPVLYAALAEAGFFSKDELKNLRKLGSILQGHPDSKRTPGIDVSSGSLGHGLAVACGKAIAGKLDQKDHHVFVLLGDGEIQEGSIWEAAMFASHYRLDNLCAIVDYNRQQIDGWIEDVMALGPVEKKWESFGWKVFETDGHDFNNLIKTLEEAKKVKGKPSVVIAKTIKGKGVSFMENNPAFHGKAPTQEEEKKALEELGG